MLFYVLLTLLLINGILLGVIVLLQAGKGGGLASMGGGAGTESLIGGRQAATILTKATWVGGGVFLFLSLVLSILSSRQQAAQPMLRQQLQQQVQQAQPAPALPGTEPVVPGTPQEAAPGAAPQQETAPPTTGQ